jgi:hypothetical protein
LRGVGTAIALPLLDAMEPATARAAAAAPPMRMAFLFTPNGVAQDAWIPATEGAGFSLPPSLEPLKGVREDLLVFTGLAQKPGQANRAGDHARGTSAFLTGAHARFTEGADIELGISVDQIAAQKVGHLTRLPSLELGTQSGKDAGNCDSGYSCAYSSNISWRTKSQPMAKEANPRLVFERLFGNQVPGETQQSMAEREARRKSILDLVAEDAKQLQGSLGRRDQEKLGEYLDSVREVERRVSMLPLSGPGGRPAMPKPEGIPSDYGDHVRTMCDLLTLAFQGDVTRISTFMFGLAGDNRPYRAIGVSDGHHDLSHHGSDAEKMAKLRKIDRYNVSLLAAFLERLKATREGSGTLLDHCMVLYGSELGDGDRHSHDDLPILLAGGGAGTLKTGRHLRFEKGTPLCGLFLSLLDRMNASVPAMGDATSPLKGLTG